MICARRTSPAPSFCERVIRARLCPPPRSTRAPEGSSQPPQPGPAPRVTLQTRKSRILLAGCTTNQTYHAFRYTDVLGLDRNAAMEAVCADFQPLLPLLFPSPDNMPTIGRVRVSGIELR